MLQLPRVLVVALLLGLAACASKPYAIEHSAENAPLRQNTIYVDNHGWHTGFIIPTAALNADLPFLRERFGDVAPYYELGWGDKGFYQSHEITTGLTMRAMFASSGSVVHVVSVPDAPAVYFHESQIIPVQLSDSEFSDLRKYIHNSFAYDSAGNAIKLTQGLYGDSQFYAGSGAYYLFNTCNKWTAKGLESTGMDISPSFKLTASSVMNYLQSRNAHSTTGNSRIMH